MAVQAHALEHSMKHAHKHTNTHRSNRPCTYTHTRINTHKHIHTQDEGWQHGNNGYWEEGDGDDAQEQPPMPHRPSRARHSGPGGAVALGDDGLQQQFLAAIQVRQRICELSRQLNEWMLLWVMMGCSSWLHLS